MARGSMVVVAVCLSVSETVQGIGPKALSVASTRGLKHITLSHEWMSSDAKSQVGKLKVGDQLIVDVVETEGSIFGVEIHPRASAGPMKPNDILRAAK